MLKDLFVPYEIAVILNNLGFKEKCLGWYHKPIEEEPVIVFFKSHILGDTSMDYNSNLKNNCHAPLYQQALDFLRINHKIEITVLEKYETPGTFSSTIYSPLVIEEEEFGTDDHTDYYACLIEAIMEAFNQIQKSKNAV